MTTYTHYWRHAVRGGYDHVEKIPCRIVSRGRTRVRIAALLKTGGEKLVTVAPESLQEKGCEAGQP